MDEFDVPLKKMKLDMPNSSLVVKNCGDLELMDDDAQCLSFTGKMAQPTASLNVTSNPIFIYLQSSPSNSSTKQDIHKCALASTTKSEKLENESSTKKLLLSIQKSIFEHLDSIEQKVQKLSSRCNLLEETLETLLLRATDEMNNKLNPASKKRGTSQFVVGLPSAAADTLFKGDVKLSTQLQYLNSEDNFPSGSWLGDPNNPDLRVRCEISPSDLFALKNSAPTPEKMALTLLDYLFDRETQACSNISGAGKYGKNLLDPMKIFGIRCHLIYNFDISEQQWQRIKLNLDSKCRTAFRRKQKGMSLAVKGFRDKSVSIQEKATKPTVFDPNITLPLLEELGEQTGGVSEDIMTENAQNQEQHVALELPSIIRTQHGDLHIIHATLEDFNQLKGNPHIEILEAIEFSELGNEDM